jgi:sporulation protein YunB
MARRWPRPRYSAFKLRAKPGLVGFLILAVFIFLAVRAFLFVEGNLRPTIISMAEARARQLATEAINNAIKQKIAQESRYEHLIFIQKDNQGKIIMAEVNNMEIAKIQALTTMSVQSTLEALQAQEIKIPLGQALGSEILANLGPRIPVTLVPVGTVSAEIQQTFESSGINIVSHQVGIDITARIQIVIPFFSSEISVHSFTPLATATYFGQVPETVINLPMPYDFEFPSNPVQD